VSDLEQSSTVIQGFQRIYTNFHSVTNALQYSVFVLNAVAALLQQTVSHSGRDFQLTLTAQFVYAPARP